MEGTITRHSGANEWPHFVVFGDDLEDIFASNEIELVEMAKESMTESKAESMPNATRENVPNVVGEALSLLASAKPGAPFILIMDTGPKVEVMAEGNAIEMLGLIAFGEALTRSRQIHKFQNQGAFSA